MCVFNEFWHDPRLWSLNVEIFENESAKARVGIRLLMSTLKCYNCRHLVNHVDGNRAFCLCLFFPRTIYEKRCS